MNIQRRREVQGKNRVAAGRRENREDDYGRKEEDNGGAGVRKTGA